MQIKKAASGSRIARVVERARQRGELPEATERELAKIAGATARAQRPQRDQARIALRIGKVLGRHRKGRQTLHARDRRHELSRRAR